MNYLTKNKHWDIVEYYNLDKLLFLLIDRPIEIDDFNNLVWKNHRKQLHRDYNFPSQTVYYHNTDTVELWWDFKNKIHRESGKPAYIDNNGYKEYYINGEEQL